ncbi:MAG: hypothetical protein GOV02_04355 [Candidatus Aenigmarchaeota archaeon]|nr:hypothetical protein [Candidatus Aenigmarchaeota archaeon]
MNEDEKNDKTLKKVRIALKPLKEHGMKDAYTEMYAMAKNGNFDDIEKGLYVTFDNIKDDLEEPMLGLGLDRAEYEKRNVNIHATAAVFYLVAKSLRKKKITPNFKLKKYSQFNPLTEEQEKLPVEYGKKQIPDESLDFEDSEEVIEEPEDYKADLPSVDSSIDDENTNFEFVGNNPIIDAQKAVAYIERGFTDYMNGSINDRNSYVDELIFSLKPVFEKFEKATREEDSPKRNIVVYRSGSSDEMSDIMQKAKEESKKTPEEEPETEDSSEKAE